MTHDIIAPWAEPVPGVAGRMTADDLARLPDQVRGYELVEGRLVRMSPTGIEHGDIAQEIGVALRIFVKEHRLGRAFAAGTGFIVSQPGYPDTVLAPDVAFVRAERIPPRDSPQWQGFLRLAPDLVVEVASPSQQRTELAAKARFWLAAGARLIWLIWPRAREVEVWRPGSMVPVVTLGISGTLDGLDVVPGFTYPIASLFA
jgi:Uma2 family endonuclease